ncbi:hypothetical protein PINS_up022961 [Pythium insidiosum]|nr:hypothetical protein PINS_up022961 [Pythium insidiosum]
MVLTKVTPLLAALLVVHASSSPLPRVDSGVHRALRQQGTVNLIVTMKQSIKEALEMVDAAPEPATRGEKIEQLVHRLQRHARESQRDVATLFSLESTATEFTRVASYWISNQLFIERASPALVERLASHPSIAEIREELVLKLPKVVTASSKRDRDTGERMGRQQDPGSKRLTSANKGCWQSSSRRLTRACAARTEGAQRPTSRGAYGWVPTRDRSRGAPPTGQQPATARHTIGRRYQRRKAQTASAWPPGAQVDGACKGLPSSDSLSQSVGPPRMWVS